MPRFERCVEAHEISLVRAGANPHAHALIRKNRKDAQSPTETTEMTPEEVQKAANAAAQAMVMKTLSWTDVTKAHFAALDEAGQASFMEKSAADQVKEADASKAAADEAAAKAEAVAKGMSVKEADLEKRIGAQDAIIADLMKRLDDKGVESDLEKAALDPTYKGFPGGVDEVKKALKSISLLPEADRPGMLNLVKAQAQMGRTSTTVLGMQEQATDLAKRSPAVAEVEGEVTKRVKDKNQTRETALYEMSIDPVWKKKTAEAAAAADNMEAE